MKRIAISLTTLAIVVGIAGCSGCSTNFHKPTTVGNAGTSALVAYSVAGFTAGQYLGLPLCATPPVYPCKTQSVNDKLMLADTAAYTAAKDADAAGNAAAAAPNLAELKAVNASPDVASQVALVNAQRGETK